MTLRKGGEKISAKDVDRVLQHAQSDVWGAAYLLGRLRQTNVVLAA